ncbi:HNH endonuclease signature motif containing protein [Sandaracinus amylolyticus]|uniref:HNH endonuclease signature motif containing protein n=1 Tax=Sandaracinus amylolyticus TaxID=927083 RepID=UPI001F440B44|nr:HNH endonuclease signature motif containing protein [Sandaracinus amylolyticus]UJR81507.1 Hypothetical protein I5071_35670 [Sandaracinus amylolyticus]
MSEDEQTRAIPEAVQRALRAEVNYGCPVPGCGNPLLTFHHFDPPFHEGRSHNPEGMIALCRVHHDAADPKGNDRGLYSTERLRAFKRAPYVTERLATRLLELPSKFVAGGGEARGSSLVVWL